MKKRYPLEAHRPRLLAQQERAFTLIELLFAFGLGVLCVGLGLSYFYSYKDAFKKENIDQSLFNLIEAGAEHIALDLQGIDFTLPASKMLLTLEPTGWLGHSFVTRRSQDHPLFSDDLQRVRYVLLEEDRDKLGGLYREVGSQQCLILPGCEAMQVTMYVKHRAGKAVDLDSAKDDEGLAYAKIRLSVKRPCVQGMQEYCFEKYVDYHYALFL